MTSVIPILKMWSNCYSTLGKVVTGRLHCSRRKHTNSFYRLSKLFQPSNYEHDDILKQGDATKVLVQQGLIQERSGHMFAFLPFGERVMQKLTSVVDCEMEALGASRITLPTLTKISLWKKSGRLEEAGPELMTVKDRHDKRFVLSPTHEEAICDVVKELGLMSYKKLPMRLYQVTPKFRDEERPRFGLIRSREFLMKDLYTFDEDDAAAGRTYEEVCAAYTAIFSKLGLPVHKVAATSDGIGGLYSHEYHYKTSTGEDWLMRCSGCGAAYTAALLKERGHSVIVVGGDGQQDKTGKQDKTGRGGREATCPECAGHMEGSLVLELGHTFLLGSRYTVPLGANFTDRLNKNTPLVMGCYGLGLSRILASVVEEAICRNQHEGHGDEGNTDADQLQKGQLGQPKSGNGQPQKGQPNKDVNSMVWPWAIAPYKVCIIGPKDGSREKEATKWLDVLASNISQQIPELRQEVVIDDRGSMTIGRRLNEAARLGYPLVVVVGKKALSDVPKFEFIDRTDGGMYERRGSNNNGGTGEALLTHLELLNKIGYLCSIMKR